MTQLNQYKSLLTTELSYILKVKGLPTSGTKPEKIGRLLEHDRVTIEPQETPKKTPRRSLAKSSTSKAKTKSPNSENSGADSSPPTQTTKDESLHWMTRCRPMQDYIDEMEAKDVNYDPAEDHKIKGNRKRDACQHCGSPFKMCKKPIDKFPNYGWITTEEALQKAQSLTREINIRLEGPDEVLYNDWDGYAELEAMQNYLREFNKEYSKKNKNPYQLWQFIQALSYIGFISGTLYMIDDGEGLEEFMGMVGWMLLATLEVIEKAGLLHPASEIKDVALVVGLFFDSVLQWPGGVEAERLTWAVHIVHKLEDLGYKFENNPFDVEDKVGKLHAQQPHECDIYSHHDAPEIDWNRVQWKQKYPAYIRLHGISNGRHYVRRPGVIRDWNVGLLSL